MIAAKNGVLEGLTEGRDPKVDFSGWGFVKDRWELVYFLKTTIEKTVNSLLKGRET